MDFIIRKANEHDAKDIIEFSKIVGSESDNLTFGKEGLQVTQESEAEYLGSLWEDRENIFLVATINKKIVGTANYRTFTRARMSHRGEFGISVIKQYWNQGIATLLLRDILNFAKTSAKAEIVSLEVRSDNLAAIHLYEKFGFEKIGTFKGYFKINNEYVDFDIMQVILK